MSAAPPGFQGKSTSCVCGTQTFAFALSNVQALVHKTELCYSKESKATTVSRAAEAAAQTARREGSGGSDKCFCFTSLLSVPPSAFSKALQSGLFALPPDSLARLGQAFPAPSRDARMLPVGTAGPSPPQGAAASPGPQGPVPQRAARPPLHSCTEGRGRKISRTWLSLPAAPAQQQLGRQELLVAGETSRQQGRGWCLPHGAGTSPSADPVPPGWCRVI